MSEKIESSPALSTDLLAILVCPIDKAKVELDGNSLVCTECGRRYAIENGIPNMLAEDEV
jgi:uncharacterized protein